MSPKHCPKCGAFIARTYVRKRRKIKVKNTAGAVESYGVHTGYKCKKCGNVVKKQ